MRISTETGSIAWFVDVETAVRMIADAGFDAWDFTLFDLHKPDALLFGDNCRNMARKLRKIGEECGIVCNQTHAPYPSTMENLPILKEALRCTAAVGAEICVIHPISYGTTEESVELYRALLPTAKEYGVKIATENLMGFNKTMNIPATGATPDRLMELVNAINDPSLVVCMDLGHTEIRPIGVGSAPMIHALGHHLQALHVHDNDLVNDSHELPLTMNIDFDVMLHALHDIGYNGYFTLEAIHYMLDHYTAETVADGVRHMATVARSLADRIDQ